MKEPDTIPFKDCIKSLGMTKVQFVQKLQRWSDNAGDTVCVDAVQPAEIQGQSGK